MSVTDRSFLEGVEYARGKIHESKGIQDALDTLDDIIVALRKERDESFDRALVVIK